MDVTAADLVEAFRFVLLVLLMLVVVGMLFLLPECSGHPQFPEEGPVFSEDCQYLCLRAP